MNKTIDILPISQELEDLTYTNIELLHRDIKMDYKSFATNNFNLNSIYRLDQNLDIPVDNSADLETEIRLYVFTNHALKIVKKDIPVAVFQDKEKFKVIGKRNYKNKACLVLLHLPAKNWEEFFKDNSPIDNQLVHVAIRGFEVQVDNSQGSDLSSKETETLKFSLVKKNA